MMNFNLILAFLTGVICATLFQQFNNGMINNGGSGAAVVSAQNNTYRRQKKAKIRLLLTTMSKNSCINKNRTNQEMTTRMLNYTI